jgi:hypothetical protein
MWASCTITASEAQNLLFLPWFSVCSAAFLAPSPEVALRRAEKIKFEKYSEGVRSRPDIRFIPFAVTKFGTLGGHATALVTEFAKQAAASKGMHVGKLLVSWRRKVSLAVHFTHADNILMHGLSADAGGVDVERDMHGSIRKTL